MEQLRIIAITQARTGSTRLPGKVLKEVNGKSLLEIHLKRVLRSTKISGLIVATTTNEEDSAIVDIANTLGLKSSRGSVNDVLDRFYQALQGFSPDYVVRITSDCPLVDPILIDKIVQHTLDHNLDYCSNTLDPSYPDGQDVEVMKYSALQKAWHEAKLASEREHVTPYIWKNSSYKGGSLFTSDNFQEGFSYGHLRMTVDEPKDLEVIIRIITHLGFDKGWFDYAQYLEENPEIKRFNETIARNEGYNKSLKKE